MIECCWAAMIENSMTLNAYLHLKHNPIHLQESTLPIDSWSSSHGWQKMAIRMSFELSIYEKLHTLNELHVYIEVRIAKIEFIITRSRSPT